MCKLKVQKLGNVEASKMTQLVEVTLHRYMHTTHMHMREQTRNC